MRITRDELQRLVENCLYEMIGEFDDLAGVHHKYSSEEGGEIVSRLGEEGDLADLKKTVIDVLEKGRWQFADIIRTEDGKTAFYAIPQEGRNPVEFGMVAAKLSNVLGQKVEQGAYNPKNNSETEGIHFVKFEL